MADGQANMHQEDDGEMALQQVRSPNVSYMSPDELKQLNVFKELRRDVSKDNANLPIFIYRTDMLDLTFLVNKKVRDQEYEDHLSVASVELTWDEGFPAIEMGTAFWGKWSFEPQQFHEAFLEYLELASHLGLRSLNDLHQLGSTASTLPYSDLHKAFILYYWDDRARAYDMFRTIQAKRLREARILQSEDSAFLRSERLLQRLHDDYFDKIDEDTGMPVWIDELTAKDAFKALEILNKVQRESLRIPASGGRGRSDDDETPLPSTPDEIRGAMQQIGEKSKRDSSISQDDTLELLRNNPEAAESAQDLVIQMNAYKSRDRTESASSQGGHLGADDGISVEDERRLQEKLADQNEQTTTSAQEADKAPETQSTDEPHPAGGAFSPDKGVEE